MGPARRGRSDRRGPYTLDRFVADLDAVRAATGQERVAVVGHSWGATLALRYALAHPDRVERLLYLGGVGIDGPSAEHRLRVAEILAREPHPDPWLLRVSAGFADRASAPALAERLTTPRFAPNDDVAAALGAVRPARVADLRRLRVPTLIAHGALDTRPPRVTDSLLAALPRVSRVVVDGAGHYPWLEAPRALAPVVRDFLSTARATAGRIPPSR